MRQQRIGNKDLEGSRKDEGNDNENGGKKPERDEWLLRVHKSL